MTRALTDRAGCYKYGVVHGVVVCQDCDWHNESYKNAQATAKIHAKKHGHKVIGDLGIAFEYDYRSDGAVLGRKR